MPLLDHIYRPLTNLISKSKPRQPVDYLVLVPSTSSESVYMSLFGKIIEKLGGYPDKDLFFLKVNVDAPFSFKSLAESYTCNVMILCGITAESIGLQSGLGIHVLVRMDGLFLLRTETPEILEKSSVDIKTLFWNCMRSIPRPTNA